jgi:hypothetical protein
MSQTPTIPAALGGDYSDMRVRLVLLPGPTRADDAPRTAVLAALRDTFTCLPLQIIDGGETEDVTPSPGPCLFLGWAEGGEPWLPATWRVGDQLGGCGPRGMLPPAWDPWILSLIHI